MSSFFKPYEGARPFFFVSYAHKQSDAVVDTIRILHDKGWRLWYDEGIPAGSDWPANIAQHMQSCERVLFFLSDRAMESPNCFSEMRTAVRQNKPILVIRLEDVPLREEWHELLDGTPEIPLLDTPAERAEAILRSGFLPRRFHHKWTEKISWRALGFAASLLFFLAAAGVLGALASGRWDPLPRRELPVEAAEPTPIPTPALTVELGGAERFFAVSFPDSQQERAIRRALDTPGGELYRWQLAEVRELYFCGNMVTDSLDNVAFTADGVCRVNGAPVIQGQVSDLSLLESAVGLERLDLICQPLGDLSALSGHTLLRELSLAGSSVGTVNDLQELPSLEILHLEHTQIQDLRPLEALPGLKTVTVSREMLPLRWNDSASFVVVLVN
ncbi:MAG: TIR domain-containing protein [Oscillospiraceae bacterium]|nr:TIR domain-containing protein [Oscillospiraceae bacterium]MBQ9250987.1 TIR domain-containing protein [Oscillospiraceae bacterium]